MGALTCGDNVHERYVPDYSVYRFPRMAEVLENSAYIKFYIAGVCLIETPLVGLMFSSLHKRAWQITAATGIVLLISALVTYLLFKAVSLMPALPVVDDQVPLVEIE